MKRYILVMVLCPSLAMAQQYSPLTDRQQRQIDTQQEQATQNSSGMMHDQQQRVELDNTLRTQREEQWQQNQWQMPYDR